MRKYNEDKQFGDFIVRTRVRYHDENIIKEELGDSYKIPSNPKFVVDIGSHIGITSLMCSQKGASVIAVEPCKDNFEVLKYNVKINGFENKITCINKGIGLPSKETKLFLHNRNSGAISSKKYNTGLDDNNYEIVEFISIRKLFDLYDIKNVDLLKMDCEGGEEEIIRDIDDELASKISQISLEFHNKKTINELVGKLSKWYVPENIYRYVWVFKKNKIYENSKLEAMASVN